MNLHDIETRLADRQARRGWLDNEELELVQLVGEIRKLRNRDIKRLVHEVHQNAIDKGWYEEPRNFGELVALMHSELSEALEDYRNGRGFNDIYYEGDKPCGIPIELADTVIRIFDTCGHLGIDLDEAIGLKMVYNQSRPERHGGKVI
ncbi:hypothetical protein [Paenibacillus apiarius]|uniref:hypothetical protein n=1 Tax=Paenibacillus apiarius TaxID=46240 RepID=UPI003B3B3FE6